MPKVLGGLCVQIVKIVMHLIEQARSFFRSARANSRFVGPYSILAATATMFFFLVLLSRYFQTDFGAAMSDEQYYHLPLIRELFALGGLPSVEKYTSNTFPLWHLIAASTLYVDPSLWLARCLQLLTGLMTLFGVFKILVHLGANNLQILLTVSAFTVSPYLVGGSFALTTDIPSICALTWALYFCLKSKTKAEFLIAATLLFSMAGLVRQNYLPMLLIPILVMIFVLRVDKSVWFKVVAIQAATLGLSAWLFIYFGGFIPEHLKSTLPSSLPNWGGLFIASTFVVFGLGPAGLLSLSKHRIAKVIFFPLFFLGSLGAIFAITQFGTSTEDGRWGGPFWSLIAYAPSWSLWFFAPFVISVCVSLVCAGSARGYPLNSDSSQLFNLFLMLLLASSLFVGSSYQRYYELPILLGMLAMRSSSSEYAVSVRWSATYVFAIAAELFLMFAVGN